MNKYILSKQANQELEDILFYTKIKWNIEQSEKYASEIFEIFRRLEENPNLGISIDYIFKNLRKISTGKHSIFYKIQNKKIIILRILHQNQDIEKTVLEK